MSTEQKLLFLDIDGTLMDFHYVVPDSAMEALRKVRENGCLCVINTGRPYLHVDPRIKALPLDGFICSCGMHVILHGEDLLHDSLTKEQSRLVVEAARVCRMEVIYESEDAMYFDDTLPMRDYTLRSRAHFAAAGVPTDRSIEDPDFCIDKFSAWPLEDSNLSAFLETIQSFCDVVPRKNQLYECVKKGYTKATGMDFILQKTGILRSNCYAIGDSANDLTMLHYVPHSIAMGNADQDVKDACEYVTTDLHDDGVYKALQHYGLF